MHPVSGGGLDRRTFTFSLIILLVLAATGGLGAPLTRGFVTFDAIEGGHFTAVSVAHDTGGPSDRPLLLRYRLVGDAPPQHLEEVAVFLGSALNVQLTPDAAGPPLYLTHANLVAPSGPAALGATTRYGMVAETGNAALAPCVIAHEIGHFLGLKHANDPVSIMYPRCEAGKLAWATVSDEETERVSRIHRIRAVTDHGLVVWASR